MRAFLSRLIGVVALAMVLWSAVAGAQTPGHARLSVSVTVVRTCGVQSVPPDEGATNPTAVRIACGNRGTTVGTPLGTSGLASPSPSSPTNPSPAAAQVSVMRGTEAMLSFAKLDSGTGVRVLVDF